MPELIELYSDTAAKVLLQPGVERARGTLITFGSFANRDVSCVGYIGRVGWVGIHVVPIFDDWFQALDIDRLRSAVTSHRSEGGPLVGFGASMGGFGAIQFAREFALDRIVVAAPQVVIASSNGGADLRYYRNWLEIEQGGRARSLDARTGLPPETPLICFCDPHVREDAWHARMLLDRSHTIRVSLAYGGHNCLSSLVEEGTWGKVMGLAIDGDRAGLEVFSQEFRRARKENYYYYCTLAEKLSHKLRYDTAIGVLDRAIGRDPTIHLAFYLKSMALTQLGRLDDALDMMRQAVDRVHGDPGRWSLFPALAHIHGVRGELDLAEQALRSGLKAFPQSPELHEAMATFMHALGNFSEDRVRYYRQRGAELSANDAPFTQGIASIDEMEKSDSDECPVCASPVTRHVPAVMADFIRARAEVPYDRPVLSNFCDVCDHVFLTPVLTGEQLARVYAGYRGYGYNEERLVFEPWYDSYIKQFDDENSEYYKVREEFYDFFLSDLNDYEGVVVDFGGSTGHFARYISPKSQVVVVEEGFERDGGDLDGLLMRTDILLCAHVFEHISQPFEVLSRLTKSLRPGAQVVVELPLEYAGSISKQFMALESRAEAGDTVPQTSLQVLHEHLAHYSRKSATTLMGRCGVQVFESYVSNKGIFAVRGFRR